MANAPLNHLQKKFSIIDLNGQWYVLDNDQISDARKGIGYVKYYKKQDAKLLLERFIEAKPIVVGDSEISKLIRDFWRSPNTQFYSSVAFDPTPQVSNVLNFWQGHGIVPQEGECKVIFNLLFNVICSGKKDHFRYLFHFLAHMLQKPDEKPDVAIIMIGGQGTGKGMFYRLLKRIWPYTMLQVHDVDDVIGRFTGAIERSYGVWMDEALFTHDRKSMERLKAAISEKEIRIEEKYEPKRTIKSHHRWFAATNNDHFGNIETDDRRFFFLRVSDAHQQDHDYFARYLIALEGDEEVPALVHALLNLDISKFDVHRRPKANEHNNQKIKSLDGIKRYLYDVLQAGQFPGGKYVAVKTWKSSIEVATKDLMDSFRKFDKTAERHRPMVDAEFVPEVKKIFPSATSKRWKTRGEQIRGVVFPSLKQARQEFTKYIGFDVEWEEIFVDDEPEGP